MIVTIARYQDRIPTDKTPEEAAAIHGAGSVYVDGKCYADILREQNQPQTPKSQDAPEQKSDVAAEVPAAVRRGKGGNKHA